MANKNQIDKMFVCFACEALKQKEKQTFSRYIKCLIKYIDNNTISMVCKTYGVKIIENKGIPLIKVQYIDNKKIYSNDLEELAAICLNVDINTIVSTTLIDEELFNFMIQQQ